MSFADHSRLAYFDDLYRDTADPYGVRNRWYEVRKREILLASLPRRRFLSAYEPGCGNGELTVQLAMRCERLLSTDWSQRAVDAACARLQHMPHVRVERSVLPEEWARQNGGFDLIVLSEVGYFLDATAMETVARHCDESLSLDGVLVACDWKPDFKERAQATKDVHSALASLQLHLQVLHDEPDFTLRVWTRDDRSIAQREGIR